MSKLAEKLRNLAYERAGDGPGGPNYDPELLDTLTSLADAIDTIERDALRYRWLVTTPDKVCSEIQQMWADVTHSGRDYPSKAEWDMAIDVAMTALADQQIEGTQSENARLADENEMLRQLYKQMRNVAAGYSNLCEDSVTTYRLGREFEKVENLYQSIA